MSAGDAAGSENYLQSLSQTVYRTGEAPPQRSDAPIRVDGVAAMSLTVGIPKEVLAGECRVAVSPYYLRAWDTGRRPESTPFTPALNA